MRRSRPFFLAWIALLCSVLSGCASTEAPVPERVPTRIEPAGKVVEYGLLKTERAGYLRDDPQSPTGKVLRSPVLEIVEQTDRVPLRPGTYFGYRYYLQFPTDVRVAELRRVLRHPPITRPDGTMTTESQRTIRKRVYRGIVSGIDGYALQEPYELVEGEWVFQLWSGEHLLVEQHFWTIPP